MKLIKEEDKDQKTLAKENKRLQIFIIIFMAIALILGTFYFNVICFGSACENKSPVPLIILNPFKSDKNIESEISNNEKEEVTNNEIAEEDWIAYLLEQNIEEIKITRERSIDLGDSVDLDKSTIITKNELKELLDNLKNNKLFKTWSEGMGGPIRDRLSVMYKKNNQTYEFQIYYGSLIVDKLDDEFKLELEKNKCEEKNTEYSNIDGAFYVYEIDNYDESIFDKYFN